MFKGRFVLVSKGAENNVRPFNGDRLTKAVEAAKIDLASGLRCQIIDRKTGQRTRVFVPAEADHVGIFSVETAVGLTFSDSAADPIREKAIRGIDRCAA